MTRALRAEARKLLTLRITFGMAGLALAYVLLNLVVTLSLQGIEGAPADLGTEEGVRFALGIGVGAYVFSFVVGVLAATGEFRHGTIVATFLAEPRRWPVVVAKLVAATGFGLAMGIAAAVMCVVVALPWLRAVDAAPAGAGAVAGALLGTAAGVALFAAIGAGLGALVRSQVAALVAGLVWLVLGEGIVMAALPEIGRWLPSGAVSSMAGTGTDMLPVWAASLLLLAYAAAIGAAAVVVTGRRDA